jgi:hypothetical protein
MYVDLYGVKMRITENELRRIIRQVILEEAAINEVEVMSKLANASNTAKSALGVGGLAAFLTSAGITDADARIMSDAEFQSQVNNAKSNFVNNQKRINDMLKKAGIPSSIGLQGLSLDLHHMIKDNISADWANILGENAESFIYGTADVDDFTPGTTSFFGSLTEVNRMDREAALKLCKKLLDILRFKGIAR